MWTHGQCFAQLTDGLAFAIFASGMYISSQFGRFFCFSALATPFLAAAVFGILSQRCAVPVVTAMLGGALCAGGLSSVLATAFHEKGRTDRMTAGLLVYFIVLACGKALSTNATVQRPLTIAAPSDTSALTILVGVVVLVPIFLAWWAQTLRGLRVRAFSQTPEFAGRFGFSEFAPYFPALLLGETVVGGAGVLTVYLNGNVNWDYAFIPGMIGIAAASMVESWLSAKPCIVKCAVLIVVVFLWRVSFSVAQYCAQEWKSLRDLDYAVMAFLMVVVSMVLMAISRRSLRKRGVDD